MRLTGIKFVDELNMDEEDRVFIRCDFNVPLDDDGNITDESRIEAALPTIDRARKTGAKVILASHLGRPKGERDESLTMKPVGAALAELLDCDVLVPEEHHSDEVDTLIEEMGQGQIMLLDNLRFNSGEKAADEKFAENLAERVNFYVNDAFGAAHRKHASVYTMAKHFDREHKAAGHLIKKEVEALNSLLEEPKRPLTAIMGGAKVSDKLSVLDKLVEKVDNVLIGGAMAYTFMKAKGTKVGASRVEEDFLKQARGILQKAENNDVQIRLPADHVVAPSIDSPDEDVETTDYRSIPDGMMGLDIGPKTVDVFSKVLKDSWTVFWNGPLGVFEREAFANGTLEIARKLAVSTARSVVGGGDSASAVRKAGVADQIDHVSTGGGAALQLLEGADLPGIDALRPHHPFD